VQLDALVVLKIVQHAKDHLPDYVTGQLLGLEIGGTLEVTNCFPFPKTATEEGDDENESETGVEYQIEMMKCLREVNVDNNTVGWYQSGYMGSFYSESTLETQYTYQDRISKSVLLVYDPLRSSQGTLHLRAYRLTRQFMELYKKQVFTKDSLSKSKISYQDVFEEVPVTIQSSPLVSAFLFELESSARSDKFDSSTERLHLGLGSAGLLEKSMAFLMECVDDLSQEHGKLQYFQRSLQRQQLQQQQWLQKRKAENAQRRMTGEALLSETGDPGNPNFKPLVEPSRLDSLLLTNQIHHQCEQIKQYTANSFTKLYLIYPSSKQE